MRMAAETRTGRHDHTGRKDTCRNRDARRAAIEWTLVVLVAAALVGAYLSIVRESNPPQDPTSTRAVLVRPGESLWSLAADNPMPGLTTAQTVEYIASLNAISSGTLPAGAVIEVPMTPYERATEVASR